MLAAGLATMEKHDVEAWMTELDFRRRMERLQIEARPHIEAGFIRHGIIPPTSTNHWDPPNIMALFEGQEYGQVAVCDHDRVEIQGGSYDGLRGTIFQANRQVGVRFKNFTLPSVYAVKHYVEFDRIEGFSFVDHNYCVLLSTSRCNDTMSNVNTTQPWVPRDVDEDVDEMLDKVALGLAVMDETTVDTVKTGLYARIAHLRCVPHIDLIGSGI
jgi:hypothetical protein